MNTSQLEFNFGPLLQLGYIVDDIDEASKAWNQQMGFGPFAVIRDVAPFTDTTYRGGESCDDLRLNIGFAYIGDIQLEMIEQLDDRPSIYKEAMDRGNRGLHHYAFRVDDYAAAYEYLIRQGFEPVFQAGDASDGFMYCESTLIPGLILEVFPWNEMTKANFDNVREFLASVDQNQLIHEFSLTL